MTCAACRSTLKMTAESKEKYGMPATPITADYECPRCGRKYRHDRQKNSIQEVP